MNAVPKISVLMAVHDAARHLDVALDSVFGQSFGDFELIAIDDGSTDATPDLLAAREDKRLRVLRLPENRGHTTALNAGLALCRGEYVARMDGDDVCHPTRFARQAAFLDANPDVGVVGSAVWIVDDAGRKLDYAPQPVSDGAIRFVMMTRNPFHHPSVMWRSEHFAGRGLAFDEAYQANQDFDLWTRALPGTRGANLRAPLLSYRVHGANISVRRAQEQRERSLEFCARFQRGFLGEVLCGDGRLANLFAALYNAPLDGRPAPDPADAIRALASLRDGAMRAAPEAAREIGDWFAYLALGGAIAPGKPERARMAARILRLDPTAPARALRVVLPEGVVWWRRYLAEAWRIKIAGRRTA